MEAQSIIAGSRLIGCERGLWNEKQLHMLFCQPPTSIFEYRYHKT